MMSTLGRFRGRQRCSGLANGFSSRSSGRDWHRVRACRQFHKQVEASGTRPARLVIHDTCICIGQHPSLFTACAGADSADVRTCSAGLGPGAGGMGLGGAGTSSRHPEGVISCRHLAAGNRRLEHARGRGRESQAAQICRHCRPRNALAGGGVLLAIGARGQVGVRKDAAGGKRRRRAPEDDEHGPQAEAPSHRIHRAFLLHQ